MDTAEAPATGKRAENAAKVRNAIEEALLEALAEGDVNGINHDRIAERAGIGRRTVYRYYPDRAALLQAGWHKLTRAANPGVGMPSSAQSILNGLETLFTGFDRNIDAMTVTMASAEGRAIRNAMTPQRVEAYRKALASETAHLDAHRRDMAIAAIQLLNSGFAWREYRDQWGLDGQDMAKASRWAIATLLRSLDAGEGPES